MLFLQIYVNLCWLNRKVVGVDLSQQMKPCFICEKYYRHVNDVLTKHLKEPVIIIVSVWEICCSNSCNTYIYILPFFVSSELDMLFYIWNQAPALHISRMNPDLPYIIFIAFTITFWFGGWSSKTYEIFAFWNFSTTLLIVVAAMSPSNFWYSLTII